MSGLWLGLVTYKGQGEFKVTIRVREKLELGTWVGVKVRP